MLNQFNDIQKFVQMRSNKEPLIPLTAPAPIFTSTVSLITNTEMNLNLKYVPYLTGSFVINQYLGNATIDIGNAEPSNILTITNNTTVNTVHYMNLEPKTQYYYNILAKSANVILLDKQSNVLATTKNIQPVITAVPTTNSIKFTWLSTLVPKQNYVFNLYNSNNEELPNYTNDKAPSNVTTTLVTKLKPNNDYYGYVETYEQDNPTNVTGNTSIYLNTSSLEIPPITVSNISNSQCTLTWKIGTAKQYGIFRNAANLESGLGLQTTGDGLVATGKLSGSYTVKNLIPGDNNMINMCFYNFAATTANSNIVVNSNLWGTSIDIPVNTPE